MREMIEIIARGVCVRAGKILLCHSKGACNTYLPGGHVELREKAKESLRREIEEELGANVTVGRFLGAVEHTFLQKGEWHCEINLVFELDVHGIDPSSAPDSREDYIEFLWTSLSEIQNSKLEPSILCKLLTSWLEHKEGPERWATTYNSDL